MPVLRTPAHSATLPAETLTVVNAHSGVVHLLNPHTFVLLDQLHLWLHTHFGIPAASVFLLGPYGIKLKFQTLTEGAPLEVYVYDKRWFQELAQRPLVLRAVDAELQPLLPPPPLPLAAQRLELLSLRQLLQTLHRNGEWAGLVLSQSQLLHSSIATKLAELNNLFKLLNVLLQYFVAFCKDIEQDADSTSSYIDKVLQHSLNRSWRSHLGTLDQVRLLPCHQSAAHSTLGSLLDTHDLAQAAQALQELMQQLTLQTQTVARLLQTTNSDKLKIDSLIAELRQELVDAFKLLPSQLAREWGSVQQAVLLMQLDYKNLPQLLEDEARTIFRIHQQQYAPKAAAAAASLHRLLHQLVQFKQRLMTRSSDVLVLVLMAQLAVVRVRDQLRTLQPSADRLVLLEHTLSLLVDLPMLYGLYLVEIARRQWWLQQFKHQAALLAELFAQLGSQEELFRKRWQERFGAIVKLLGGDPGGSLLLSQVIPLVEVSVLSPSVYASQTASPVTRDDAVRFVDSLKRIPQFSHETPHMLSVSKAGGSLSVVLVLERAVLELDDKMAASTGDKSTEQQAQLVQGLRQRISKLESLLHTLSLGMQRLPLSMRLPSAATTAIVGAQLPPSRLRQLLVSISDLVALVQRRFSAPSSTRRLNSSLLLLPPEALNALPPDTPKDPKNTIDKHLENIRLRREQQSQADAIQQLQTQLAAAQQQLTQEREQSAHQETQNRQQQLKLANHNEELTELVHNKDTMVDELTDALTHRDLELKEMAARLQRTDAQVAQDSSAAAARIHELTVAAEAREKVYAELQLKVDELTAMKSDLLANMGAKEDDMASERRGLGDEIVQLKARIEELEEHAGDAAPEAVQYVARAHELTDALLAKFTELCLVLEAVGLMLVRHGDEVLVIRVKGLKARRENEEVPMLEVYADVAKAARWDEGDGPSADSGFRQFLDSATCDHGWLLKAVAKRFSDIEGLAKKLQKETRGQKTELAQLAAALQSKVAIRGFQQDDLVMFLPTRDDLLLATDFGVELAEEPPWAAFNVGAPHYFLKPDSRLHLEGRDWMVGRVRLIESHSVTEANADLGENPFHLLVGVTWFYVEVEEESL